MTEEKKVQHTMTHALVIENHKCVINVTVYNNEDLKIVLEDLTSKDIFQYDESSIAIETFTAKCKSTMTGLEFYNLCESIFDGTNTLNTYVCCHPR